MYLSFVILALMFAACTPTIDPDESSANITSPTPEVVIEPAPTNEETRDEDIFISLVEAQVREIEGYDESVEIEVNEETSLVSLPGLRLFAATPMVVDSLDIRCAAHGQQIWCSQGALENIVRQFSLGAHPEQLSDDEWLKLVSYFTYTAPLANVDELGSKAQFIPISDQEKISEPLITRHQSGGLAITFYFVGEDIMGFGDVSLNVLEVLITEDDTFLLENLEIWNNFDREE